MQLDITKVFILSIILQLIIFSFYLFHQSKNRKISNILLGAFFLSLAFNLLTAICSRSREYLFHHAPFMFYIGSPFAFLYTPAFYLYIKSLTKKEFSIRNKDIVHLTPFLAFSIYLTFAFFTKSAEEMRNYLIHNSKILWTILTPVLHILILIYAIFIIRMVRNYRREIKEFYSSVEKINYSWLQFIFFGMLLLWLADIVRFLTAFFTPQIIALIETTLFSIFLCLCYLVLFKAISYPLLFSTIKEQAQPKRKSLSKSLNDQYLEKLLWYMENKKPYLDPDLDLFKLAETVAIPPRSLSEVIKNSMNQNFYDFINCYRIRESELLLSNPVSRNKTVLEVLYEVGFNSKSSFNLAFKRITGQTPSQYKKYSNMLPN